MTPTCKRRPGGGGAAVSSLADDNPQHTREAFAPQRLAQIITKARLRELQRRLDAWAALPPAERRAIILGQSRP